MTMNERYLLSVFVMQVSPIPLQRTGFPSGRIFLHISKQIRCFGFFLGEPELRQALKSRRRQGGSLQCTVEEAEAADQTSVPEPGLADLGTAWLLCQKGGEHANQAMQATPGAGVMQLKEAEKKPRKKGGKKGPGLPQNPCGQVLRYSPLFLGQLFFLLLAACLGNRGERTANWEMCFQHHLGYRFSDTECFKFFSSRIKPRFKVFTVFVSNKIVSVGPKLVQHAILSQQVSEQRLEKNNFKKCHLHPGSRSKHNFSSHNLISSCGITFSKQL